MKNNRLLTTVLLVAAVLLSAGCGKFKDIKVTSYDLAAINPTGFKAVALAMDLGVDNPAMGFKVVQLQAQVYHNGVSLGTVYVDPVIIRGRRAATYRVDGHLELGQSVSLIQAASYFSNFKPEEFKVDVDARIKLRSGIAKILKVDDISLDELLEKLKI